MSTNISDLLSFRADSVHIPGVTFETQQTHRFGIGPSQKYPTNVNFNEVSISFIEDRQSTIWKFLNSWINGIFQFANPVSPGAVPSYNLQYKDSYSTDITVNLYNNEGKNNPSA